MHGCICVEKSFAVTESTIDLLSFDIGEINMGVARIRYDYVSKKFCILNAMLMNIYNPLQIVNENDLNVEEQPSFPVSAYYAESISENTVKQLNKQFSNEQLLSRKRARITEHTDQALEFATNKHPQKVAKRRRTKFESKEISNSLAKSGPLMYAQLVHSLDIHTWISDISNIHFILLEQQLQSKAENVAIFASLITFFEMKRKQLATNNQVNSENNWNLKPFIKSCSASNKLAQVTDALHESWIMHDESNEKFMTAVQIRALLKEHFLVTESMVNTQDYGKRKISSKKEITHFFCGNLIKKAREMSLQADGTLPKICSETVINRLTREPVNSYAHWIVNQLKEKNNVTDAILQAFAWINTSVSPLE